MKIGLLCGREYAFPPAFLERVNALGGAVIFGPTSFSSGGWFAVIRDPVGVVLALTQAGAPAGPS